MNTKGVKLLLFGLIMVLFSLMLVFAGFVIVLLRVAPAIISASGINTSYTAGRGAYAVVVLAIVAGIGGLFAAWFGVNRND